MEPNESSTPRPGRRLHPAVTLGVAICVAFLLGTAFNSFHHPQVSQAQAPATQAGEELEYAVFDYNLAVIALPNQAIQGKASGQVGTDNYVEPISDLAKKIDAKGWPTWRIGILNRLAEDGWYIVTHTSGDSRTYLIDLYHLARKKRK